MFGLLQFIFRLNSRRAFNEEATSPTLFNVMKQFFPEIETVPHGDTVARFLQTIEFSELEAIHISLIRDLIKNKKFKRWLIQGSLPISIDGTQKAVRDDQLEPEGWLVRKLNTKNGERFQQYIIVVEANITLHNGLTIPLLTERCVLDEEAINNEETKQDSENKAFHRLVDKLKVYFPKLKIMIILDNLYATKTVIADLKNRQWEFMIKLPSKLKALYEPLATKRNDGISLPEAFYRQRRQTFHWLNNQEYEGATVHTVGCKESYKTVCRVSGEIIQEVSENTWISSLPLSCK